MTQSTKGRFYFLNTSDLEEIYACMEDSDRYINENVKARIMLEIKDELSHRGLKK